MEEDEEEEEEEEEMGSDEESSDDEVSSAHLQCFFKMTQRRVILSINVYFFFYISTLDASCY